MASMTFISWIYHFLARFWPYFNFVDFRAYFGHFSHVKMGKQRMAGILMKMASKQKMQENKPTLKFNFTIEKRWGVSKFSFWHSHWALAPTFSQVKGHCSSFGRLQLPQVRSLPDPVDQARLELVHARRKLTRISSGMKLLKQSRPPLTLAALFFPAGAQRISLSILPGGWSGRGGHQTPPQRRRPRCRGPFQVSQVSSLTGPTVSCSVPQ